MVVLIKVLTIIILMAIARIDYKTCYINPRLNGCMLGLGILLRIIEPMNLSSLLVAILATSGVMVIMNSMHTNSFGGGDIKLFISISTILGMYNTVLCFILSVFSATIYVIVLYLTKSCKKKLAFGPFIFIGYTISLLYGNKIIEWYYQLLF